MNKDDVYYGDWQTGEYCRKCGGDRFGCLYCDVPAFTQKDVAILRALAGLEEAALIRTMFTFPSETISGAVRSIADRIEAGLL